LPNDFGRRGDLSDVDSATTRAAAIFFSTRPLPPGKIANMKQRERKSRPRPVSDARWLAYAAAGAATLFAGEQTADATIHYSGRVDVRLPRFQEGHATFRLDQPGHSIFFDRLPEIRSSGLFDFAGFKVFGDNGGSFRGTSFASYAYVSRLRRGDSIAQGIFGHGQASKSAFGTLAIGTSIFPAGYFTQQGIGYIAFSFNQGTDKRYGWARVRMLGARRGNDFEILDYAYADPGENIKAGQISSDGAMVTPEPGEGVSESGSLGLLAAGAAGLMLWRKKRSRAASSI
jgi:hypothetical protein